MTFFYLIQGMRVCTDDEISRDFILLQKSVVLFKKQTMVSFFFDTINENS